ncbi:UDP-4-amino-4,6-dideoxy-N-acetyl-beta-L-altrosamine N-acetyltransferase [Pseudidiomarina maritima]|uniref:UDP-4-amino-4,6-dideoxy-N-acetyl-beta-L-altrosamine N-acetyltransferase n=1 Tax=Pseudidiomarina maritima TaxID=519453 RepID=A0A1I6GS07_9GAMM|nr:UDP-4-amino-4,6-dideoxy-N-acetyl-beta-L-altrosamine N-acetyltransferase [Pseudidiomarina maritima]SFR45025.1 UDP-4-amino-4,6-dideoxy-N-acetyl-beta-L-altrosamine N-acetyltransferase [Pseudidiomarina maritima]
MVELIESKLRDVKIDDLPMIRSWRNDISVRRFMYTTHEISEKEHVDWYNRIVSDPSIKIFIYEENGKPLGFLNFTSTRTEDVANWGFYLNPEAPKGTGHRFGKSAISFGFNQLKLHKICGEALAFNERSVKFHRSLGFVEEGQLREQHFDGSKFHDVICFGLLSRDAQNINLNN